MQDTIIFDLDGTLALIDHRRHWLDKSQHPEMNSDARWRAFFAACLDDQPNQPVIEILHSLYRRGEHRIVIFSGRSNEVQSETREWLARYDVDYDQIWMRQAGDHTNDVELKRTWLQSLGKDRVLCVFDDRDAVVQMWRAEGISCFQVAPGGF